jgi:hypothetical protein
VNKLAVLVLLVATRAFAEPPATSPWGSSPNVIAYQPPPEVDRAHHGLTLEAALGGGTTSSDTSKAAVAFAIGGWVTHDCALAFRVTVIGSYQLEGVSIQYYATPALWAGVGLGNFGVNEPDEFGGANISRGLGGFARAGWNLAASGSHALYLSGEVQAGTIADQTHGVALVAIGYQLL